MQDKIEGRNPVMEALRAGREIDRIYVKKGEAEGSIVKILRLAREKGVLISEVEKQKLDAMSETGSHQGVIAQAPVKSYATVEDMLEKAKEKGEPPFLILCDKITDPHNLGSIIRTANAAGAHGVIIPKHNSVTLNATVGKASAGAVEFTPVAKVTNLSKEIDALKEEGLWIAAADAAGKQSVYQADLTGPIALVIGSEGEGISRLVKEKCDFLLSIPMRGEINSLNASVAAAVLMYEVVRARGKNDG